MRMIFDINLTSSLTSITTLYKRDDQTNVFCLLLLFALEFVFILGGTKILMIDFTVIHYIPIAYKSFHQKKRSFLYCYLQGFVLFCWGCETNKKSGKNVNVSETHIFIFMFIYDCVVPWNDVCCYEHDSAHQTDDGDVPSESDVILLKFYVLSRTMESSQVTILFYRFVE